jgi:hypothetical protein
VAGTLEMDTSTILALVSILLTALFGILGLLTDFRKADNKVSVAGKISLCGILVTSLVSAALTLVTSHEHEQEIGIQLNPMDKNIEVRLEFTLREDKGALAKAILDRPGSSELRFYLKGPACSSFPLQGYNPDLVFIEDAKQEHGAWFDEAKPSQVPPRYPGATSLLTYSLLATSSKMTSFVQIPGSTPVVSFNDFESNQMTLNRAVLRAAQGVSISVPSRAFAILPHWGFLNGPDGSVWTHEACYTFPK